MAFWRSAVGLKPILPNGRQQKTFVDGWTSFILHGAGPAFLHHPLLRGGFLDDVYECFEDQGLADEVMTRVSEDMGSFTPLLAQRCVLSGWKP